MMICVHIFSNININIIEFLTIFTILYFYCIIFICKETYCTAGFYYYTVHPWESSGKILSLIPHY